MELCGKMYQSLVSHSANLNHCANAESVPLRYEKEDTYLFNICRTIAHRFLCFIVIYKRFF